MEWKRQEVTEEAEYSPEKKKTGIDKDLDRSILDFLARSHRLVG